MKIKKNKGNYHDGVFWFYHYYVDTETTFIVYHGLKYNSRFNVGYWYHGEKKGFLLSDKVCL